MDCTSRTFLFKAFSALAAIFLGSHAMAVGFADLPASRFTDISGWTTPSSPNYNCSNTAGWSATKSDMKKTGSVYTYAAQDGTSVAPPVLLLLNNANATITSPVLDGVGIIKFNSRMQDWAQPGKVLVQVAVDEPPTEWTTVYTCIYPSVAQSTTAKKPEVNGSIALNNPDVKRVRFQRVEPSSASETGARILFDNIALTPLPAKVSITPSAYTPANPSQSTPITFSVTVGAEAPYAAADSVTSVKVRYQLTSSSVVPPTGPWGEIALEAVPGTSSFTGTLPALNETGHLWYYYECVYQGYHFGDDDNFSPAYNTADGMAYNTAPTSGFYHFDVTEFAADFENVIFDGVDGSAARIVGDNLWEITVRVKGLESVSGNFIGVSGDSQVVWGDPDQSSTSAPFGGSLVVDGSAVTVANCSEFTHLVFTNDTANLTYTVAGANLPVVITFENNSITADPQTNGEKSEVSVNLSTSDGTSPNVCVVFRNYVSALPGYTKWTTNSLDVSQSGSSFVASGLLPALLENSIQYYFIASDENLIPLPAGDVFTSATNSVVVAAKPGDTRYTGFDNWVRDGDSYYSPCANGDRWTGSGIALNSFAVNAVNGKPLPVALLLNKPLSEEPGVISPVLDGGVGTIFYESRIADEGDGEVSIQITTEENPGPGDWVTVKVVKYNLRSSSVVRNDPVTLNRHDIKRVRFLRTGASSVSDDTSVSQIILDEIVISRPPTDVLMAKRLNEPGYPSMFDNIKMRCYVTDESDDTPAVNRRVKLWYQHTFAEEDVPVFRQEKWTFIEMTDMGDNHYFECYVPSQKVGYVWYFFQADFDGYRYDSREDKGSVYLVDGVNGYGNPATGKSVTPLNKNTDRLQIRPFMSPDGSIVQYVTCTPTDAEERTVVITNELKLVGHNQWQSLLDITKFSHVESYFHAYDHYTTGADYFEGRPRVWGERDQGEDERAAPLGNYMEMEIGSQGGDLGPLVVSELEKDGGSLLFRFSTEDGYYIVKRAVYQDFDEWQASEDNYEESLGGSETLTEEASFDDWSLNYFDRDVRGEGVYTPFYKADCSDDFIRRDVLCTSPGFVRTQSRGIEERKINKNQVDGNFALSLKKGDGSLVNNGTGYTRGVNELTFKARSTIDDDYFALYKNGLSSRIDSTTPNLYFSATWELSQRGPSKCYFSYIFFYQPASWSNPATWFELRVVQTDGLEADNEVRYQLWRHGRDGNDVLVKEANAPKRNLSQTGTVTLKIFKNNGNNLEVQIAVDDAKSFTGYSLIDNSQEGKDMMAAGGTFGFGVYDAIPKITVASASTGMNGTAYTKDIFGTFESAKWDNGGNGRWSIASGLITRAIPTQTLEINYAPCVDYAPAPSSWELQKKQDVTVSSLEYKDVKVPFKVWNPQFVEINYASGDAGVVIDDVEISAWRGWTRGKDTKDTDVESYDWKDIGEQDTWVKAEGGWAVLQGMIDKTAGVAGNSLYFETTRACPATEIREVGGEETVVELPIQGIVSPKLANGVGSIKFSSQALVGRCVYAVDVTDPALESRWWTKAVFTNEVAQDSVRRFVSIRQLKSGNHIGRVRIRLIPELSDPDAKLVFDNVSVKDYPPRDAATWLAWNARVTASSDDPPDSRVEDPTRIYNASGKSCFLNNSLEKGCADEDFSAHEPYIQSPEVGTGIGEISFQYRCFARNDSSIANTNAAVLIIKAAPFEDYPEEDWVTITNMEVTGTAYVTFQNEKIYDLNNKVVRFYSSTNSAERICIDNILITEPVRASFEFFSVRLLPEQPVVGSNSVIEAEIGRFLMNPRDIKIYVSVYEGDDVWGYESWWRRTNGSGVTRYLLKQYGDDPKSRVYRSDAVLPARNVDDVVQYVVWGTHAEIGASDPVIFMTKDSYKFETVTAGNTNVVNYVPWYSPVDLNETRKDEGWSPYYFVYSCAPGSIWFNELSYYNSRYPNAGDYVEFLGYAGIDIGNWKLEFFDSYGDSAGFGSVTIPGGTRLPRTEKGWGMYVVGDKNVASANIKLTKYDGTSRDKDLFGRETSGAFILSRSNGSYERRICYGVRSDVQDFIDDGFEYIGRRATGANYSLSLAAKDSEKKADCYEDFEWTTSGTDRSTPSPGAINGTQIENIADLGGDDPAATYIFISVVHGLYGSQTYGEEEPTTAVITREIEEGEPVSISYSASDWHRIGTLKSNGNAVAAAAGAKTYTFSVEAISGDVSNEVSFAELSAADRFNCPVSWLSTWSEAAVAAGDGDDLSVFDEYLLNTDPTVTTDYSLKFTGVSVDSDGALFSVELLRSENNTPVTSAINGVLGISGFGALGDIGGGSAPVYHDTFDVNFAGGNTTVYESVDSADLGSASFFKAAIEERQ